MAQTRRSPREEVLRRCFELPWRDQYEVWRVLGEFLQAGGATEPGVAKELREREEALGCVRRAAKHLSLASGEAPTVEQYTQARRDLDLPLSARQVELRWEKWRFVKLALADERLVETPAQRSLRRAASGRRREHEEHLTGLREWLETNPASTTRKDYDYWAAHRNAKLRPDQSPVVLAAALMDVFVLEWDRLMRVATLADDLDTAQREYLEDLTTASGPLRLVGVTGVALICGVRKAQAGVVARSEGFPAPAALLRRSHIWYRDEVEAYHQGKEVRRRESSLQAQILDSAEVCKRLNVAIGTLTAGIHARKPWAPQPTGAVSTSLYWLRDDFEAWFRTRTKVRKRDAKRTAKGV